MSKRVCVVKTAASQVEGTIMATGRQGFSLQSEAGRVLGGPFCEVGGTLPTSTPIRAPLLPAYLLYSGALSGNALMVALSSSVWVEIAVCPFSWVFVYKSHLPLWNRSYFSPLWVVSGLKGWEGLVSRFPHFPGKSPSHPLKSHLLGNRPQWCGDGPDSASELPRSPEETSYRHVSLKDTCLRTATKSWPKSAFSLRCSRVSTLQGEEADARLSRQGRHSHSALLTFSVPPIHHSPLAPLPSSSWNLVLCLGSAKLPPRSHCLGTGPQDLF